MISLKYMMICLIVVKDDIYIYIDKISDIDKLFVQLHSL